MNNTSSGRDLRLATRRPVKMSVRAFWLDKTGQDKYAIVRSVDISASGVRIELPEAPPPRSIITLQSQPLGLHGSGTVRYCTRVPGGKYVVGIEFVGGLKYKALENESAPASSLSGARLP